jgi:AmmeMemoRadiSam system protein B
MEKKTRHYIGIIIALIIISGIVFSMPLLFRYAGQYTNDSDINIVDKFESENFIRALDEKGERFARCDGRMVGAVVPHHMVGGQFIADVFSQAKNVDTVVVIGPNHWEKGSSSIITSNSDWITGKGRAHIDKNFIDGLISKKIATAENNVIVNDHSIGNILPFVAYYLPTAKVIPIILKRDIPRNQFDNLLHFIADKQKTVNMLVIGSVDFSHYLTAQQSEKEDEKTIEAILNRDHGLISTFRNDNMDSPSTVNALLKITDMIGANKMLWRNSNSFKVLGSDINNTTSYFELVFCKNE